MATGAEKGRSSGLDRHDGVPAGRIGHGKGSGRPLHSPSVAAEERAVRRDQFAPPFPSNCSNQNCLGTCPSTVPREDLQWEKGYGPWNAYCQSKLADLLFATELARRSAAAGSALLSDAAHPGYARTNLQRTGPARPKKIWIEKVIEFFMSQDAAAGALPTLRAATAPDASSGAYYAPSRLFGLKGDPVLVPLPKPARDEQQAARLWETAEKLTGVTLTVPAAR